MFLGADAQEKIGNFKSGCYFRGQSESISESIKFESGRMGTFDGMGPYQTIKFSGELSWEEKLMLSVGVLLMVSGPWMFII